MLCVNGCICVLVIHQKLYNNVGYLSSQETNNCGFNFINTEPIHLYYNLRFTTLTALKSSFKMVLSYNFNKNSTSILQCCITLSYYSNSIILASYYSHNYVDTLACLSGIQKEWVRCHTS